MVAAEIWGPITWKYLHNQAHCFPENPSINEIYKEENNLLTVIDNLPCGICRTHANEYVSKNPPRPWLKNRHTWMTYLWNFHNNVRVNQGKSKYKWMIYMNDLQRQNIKTYKEPSPNQSHTLLESFTWFLYDYLSFLMIILIISIGFILLNFKNKIFSPSGITPSEPIIRDVSN